METITLEAAQDHVLAQTRLKKPLIAIEELIWNSLDADATSVEVTLGYNKAGGLDRIQVEDNGHGIAREECNTSFGFLGGSPKLKKKVTPSGRRLHGKLGRGRLKAFGLGREVTWRSYYTSNGDSFRFDIKITRATIRNVSVSDATKLKTKRHGVVVEIAGFDKNFGSLDDANGCAQELARRLALYLNAYPNIAIRHEGVIVDPKDMEDNVEHYDLEVTDSDGNNVASQLTVIEWKYPVERTLYLCDPHGVTKDEKPPGIQAPGFQFTAYFKSDIVDRLDEENAFALDELHPEVKQIIDVSKDALRTHFRKREKSRHIEIIANWKKDQVYPYKTEATDPLETAEREVFDLCAIKVHEYLPKFDDSDTKNKQLTFRLIREALETNPTSLQTILREVLSLPQEQQDDLAAILERTSLASIINAANMIVSRLTFLETLEPLLFGELKKTLLERTQLQKILVNELWLFGEQYDLGVDDESLKNLLKKHVEILRRDDINPTEEEVKDIGGKQAIVDLMLYRRFPHKTPESFEHLVVELKRPSCKLGEKELSQIEKYGITVAKDERFHGANVRWKFLLIGNALNDFASEKCDVQNRDFGHIYASRDGRVDIHVTTWATIVSEAKWRYQFLQKELQLRLSADQSLAYLHEKYSELFAKS